MILVKDVTEKDINATIIDMHRSSSGMHFSLGSVKAFLSSLLDLYHAICANFNFLSDTFFGGYDHLHVTEPPEVTGEINVSTKKPILFRMKENAVNAFNAVLNKIEMNYSSSYKEVSSSLSTTSSLTDWATQSNAYYSSAEALMNTRVSPLIGEMVQSGGVTTEELYEITSEASDNADEVIEEAVEKIIEKVTEAEVKEDDVATVGVTYTGPTGIYDALTRKAEETARTAETRAKEEQEAKERAETARGRAEAAKADAAKAEENAEKVNDVTQLWFDLLNGAPAEPVHLSGHYVDEDGNIVTVSISTTTSGDGKTSFSTYTTTVTNPVTGESTRTTTSITHEGGSPITPTTATHVTTSTSHNDGKGTVTTTETTTTRAGGIAGLFTGAVTETTTTTVESNGVEVSKTSEEQQLTRDENYERSAGVITDSRNDASEARDNAQNAVEGSQARAEQAEAEAESAEQELSEAHTAAEQAQQEANDAVVTDDSASAAYAEEAAEHFSTLDTTGMSDEEVQAREDAFNSAYQDARQDGASEEEAVQAGNEAAQEAAESLNNEGTPNE